MDGKTFHNETLFALILAVMGLGFVINPFGEGNLLTLYHGITLLIESAVEVISVAYYRRKEKKEEEEQQ